MQLYTYYRSSAAFRVRIALNLKQVDYQSIPIHLLENGGEHKTPQYRAINPQALVPSFVHNEHALNQSLAIIEYLEERFPAPALLPSEATAKAKVRAFALAICADIHPLNNLRVLSYLENQLAVNAEQKQAWYHHWLKLGFDALEIILANQDKSYQFCFNEQPGLADCFLVPQIYNAIRFDYSMKPHLRLEAIYKNALENPAFVNALPENQD